jgi:hypothetical protein
MLLGHLMYVAQLVAKQQGLEKGFRVVVSIVGTNSGALNTDMHTRNAGLQRRDDSTS